MLCSSSHGSRQCIAFVFKGAFTAMRCSRRQSTWDMLTKFNWLICFWSHRVHSCGVCTLLLHLQYVEGTIAVFGGSVRDARLQRYKNFNRHTSKMGGFFILVFTPEFLSAGNGIGKGLLTKVAEVTMCFPYHSFLLFNVWQQTVVPAVVLTEEPCTVLR